tara:strand:+ start:216 stop:743 length:528 start_codon:yes stop_codon:yes gene_type:complete
MKLLPLAGVVPDVLKALGSDKAAEAAEKVVNVAKAVTGQDSGEDALQALQASPDQALAFQKAMSEERLEFARLALAETQAYLGDTQDARARDAKLAEAGYRNSRANTMLAGAGLVVVGVLAVILWNSPIDEFVKATVSLVLGRALGYIDQGFNFEFGTTRSSGKKDDTILAQAAR